MLSALATSLSLCTVGKRVDGGGGGQGQRARRSSSAQDAGTAAVAARSTAVLLHSDGGSRGLQPRQPLPAAADASARPRLLAGCATAWQPSRPWWPFLPLLSRRRGHAVSGGAATLGTPPSPAPSSSFLPWRLRWRTLRGGETAGLARSGGLELGPWRRQPDLAASTSC